MDQPDLKVLKQFDKNKDGKLDSAERVPAREYVRKQRPEGQPRRFGPPGGRPNESAEPPKPGDLTLCVFRGDLV